MAQALRDDLTGTLRRAAGWMGVAEVVQPDHGQLLLAQRLVGPDDLAGEA